MMNSQQAHRKHLIEKVIAENDGRTFDFLLPDHLTTAIIGYTSMSQDLKLCTFILDQMHNDDIDPTLSLCLHYTLIALYGKCFTDATASKLPKLEESVCFQGNEDMLKTHKELIELRHTFVAHRGLSLNEYLLPIFQLRAETLELGYKVKQIKQSAPNDLKLRSYRANIDYLLVFVEDKYQKAVKRTIKHVTENYRPDQLHEFLIAGPDWSV